MSKSVQAALPILAALNFPVTLLRHAIRVFKGPKIPSVFADYARSINDERVRRGVAELATVPIKDEFAIPCFWLGYFARNHTKLALTPEEMDLMVEALRQDGIFVPLHVECKTSLQPLIAQIVTLNRTIQQQQNQQQLFAAQQGGPPPAAAGVIVVDQQAVFAAAAAASAAGAVSSDEFTAVPRELASPTPEWSGDAVDSPGSHASLASTFAASSASSPNSMADDHLSQAASQGHPASLFGDDDQHSLMEPELNLRGSAQGNTDKDDPVLNNQDDVDAGSHKRQRRSYTPSAFLPSLLLPQPAMQSQGLIGAPAPAVAPVGSPVVAASNFHYPLHSPLTQSVSEKAGFPPNAPGWESLLAPHLQSGASFPVPIPSSPRE